MKQLFDQKPILFLVIRVRQVEIGLVHQLFMCIAEQFAKRVIGIQEFSIYPDLRQADASVLEDGLVATLAPAQGIFHLFTACKFLFQVPYFRS
ncbi:hypothetical protein TSA66_12395 [Noviherbaspirillum autotrophicum]|uniref:Uncharacterized protein n=1 Tax=Noviherbaspirillum autotrophicum TaxID=709839 RepID=A0A0C2BN55_9BURK|nr:hypothetical protein TSA66_12395 [Noviherbaspirillum autotrophicum]